MALWTNLAHATIKRQPINPSLLHRMRAPVQRSTINASSQKTWISKYVKAPKRPMTDGEYAFLQAAKITAMGLGGVAYVGGAIYISFFRPYPPRMLQMMEELPPADAKRLWDREHEVHIGPRLY